MTAPCSCPVAGYCDRHQITKDEHLFKLCQTREDYRRSWDEHVNREAKRCTAWKQEGERTWICTECGKRAGARDASQLPKNRLCVKAKPPCPPPPPGPGTELAEIFKSLGIQPKTGCGCELKSKVMDAWGVDGCRARSQEIIAWLRKAYEETDRWERVKAATMSLATGLAFRALKIDWTDPFPGVLAEAIRRAEEKYPREDWLRWTEKRGSL